MRLDAFATNVMMILKALVRRPILAWQASLFFALGWSLLSAGLFTLRRWLMLRAAGWLRRAATWCEWPFVGYVLDAIASVGWLYVLSLRGIYAKDDSGLQAVSIGHLRGWWPQLILGFSVWVALLWHGWWRDNKSAIVHPGSFWKQLPLLLAAEAQLAILRAGLMPWAGRYWGSLAAAGIRFVGQRGHPAIRQELLHPEERGWRYLLWATDWISSAIFLLAQSLWPLLATRLLIYVSVAIVAGVSARRLRRAMVTESAPEEGGAQTSPEQ